MIRPDADPPESMMNSNEILKSLPPALSERTRWIGHQNADFSGEYVLYWMRTAIRAEENPALETAIELANHLARPLLVYQGLSERYPYASDRHHTFVLQGARDVQQALAAKNIAYVLHLQRPGHRGPHLRTLADQAAVVVTEDMPTEPLRRWTTALRQVITSNVAAVDTACVVPMQLVGRSYERAFEFRKATHQLFAERVSAEPSVGELRSAIPPKIDLPFEPIDLSGCDIATLVSQCEIDHSVGPVPHTVGGSQAGYQRWQDFKDHGLSNYDRRRNNAVVDGVSKMSPYLHYGMVAATRIAREAAAVKSKAAEKYLDELLIWRELAYAFCRYRADHGRVAALPQWALQTLSDHERDDRPSLSWETMARGCTGDPLWDSAQRSLLVHGELHNNVRMTWGKAVLSWTPNAKKALARLIDLNHRYALDGRDPASYGGILWCLGQFDRPFSPAQPIFGTVRTRSTRHHAKRLDLAAYQRKVTRPLWSWTPKVAVIGAGISGLVCARTLADHGCDVSVYEKSGEVGSFDYGVPYFIASDDRFKRYVRSWIEDRIVEPWHGRVVTIDKCKVRAEKTGDTRYIAVPGVNSIGKHLASDLNVQLNTKVMPPMRQKERWLLESDQGHHLGEFDLVVVAVPSHQAAAMLVEAPELSVQCGAVETNHCWALTMSFEQSLQLGYDVAFVDDCAVARIARNDSKPDRVDGTETWRVHATPEWTEAHLDDPPEQVSRRLQEAFSIAVDASTADPQQSSVQRWRNAIPSDPCLEHCLFDDQRMIGACGDWCGSRGVEGAFLSGMAISGQILGRLNSASTSVLQVEKGRLHGSANVE
ncbi:MAG: FAD-dependent oxidoreductase [Planctomycetota bacterium]